MYGLASPAKEVSPPPSLGQDGAKTTTTSITVSTTTSITTTTSPITSARDDRGSGEPRSEAGGDGEDEEDEEDEKGMPNAVRMPEPSKICRTSIQEQVKERHTRAMEDIARSQEPGEILAHLLTSGYFNVCYWDHARTTVDNLNMKNGRKKGVERLYSLLCKRIPNMIELP
ncbi:uncharacterized protein LOC101847797 [Aplysia californica]|nr:uncharacterized protein LOC101847797 [Aplysia californica]